MNKGIAVAGNMLVDHIKTITNYPEKQALTYIEAVDRALGGAVCNVGIDLARLNENLQVHAIGFVGEDSDGDYIKNSMSAYPNMNLERVYRKGITTFTDVMTEKHSKQRTFFTYRGADSYLMYPDFKLDTLSCSILHVGYILLLIQMDSPDEEYGTALARVLHDAQIKGIKTSIDVVSLEGGAYKKMVPPAVRYADYCIINETEAAHTTGIEMRDDSGALICSNAQRAIEELRKMGAKEWIILHAPEAAFGMDRNGKYFQKASLELPSDYIQGSVGAGDAFCAGTLYCAHEGGDIDQAMDAGIATAAGSLSMASATDGVRDFHQMRALLQKYGRQSID